VPDTHHHPVLAILFQGRSLMTGLTLDDIAKKAGVSRSTVSRVVNGQPDVRSSVRKRVLEVIQSTGYHPNAAAQTLASHRSWMIGLVLPRSVSSFFSDPYFPRLTQGIAQACNQHNYTLGLFLVGSKEDEEKFLLRLSSKGFLDGVVIQSGQQGDILIERLVQSTLPVVIAGRPFESEGISYIDVDNCRGAYRAVKHLIDLGHQRIATIAGSANSTVSIDRMTGYVQAMQDHGMKIDPVMLVGGDFTESGGHAAMRHLLAHRPDAVFAASDIMAIGAMRAAREAGLRIPHDIAFIGYDDLPLATLTQPPLSTIRQPVFEFGIKAVELVIDLIQNGIHPEKQLMLDTELIIRDSCGSSLREGAALNVGDFLSP
jgi:LacI family transcriptional regulator